MESYIDLLSIKALQLKIKQQTLFSFYIIVLLQRKIQYFRENPII